MEEFPMIQGKVTLTQPGRSLRQFAATTGSGHHLLLDDAAGGTGPKPIELVAVALAVFSGGNYLVRNLRRT